MGETEEKTPPMQVVVHGGRLDDAALAQMQERVRGGTWTTAPFTIPGHQIEIRCLWCQATGRGDQPFEHRPGCAPPPAEARDNLPLMEMTVEGGQLS